MVTPNFSNFFSAIDKAEKQATIKIKPEIDNSFMGGLSNSLTGQKGKFSSVGKELGSSLTMGMQQQFGMAGGVASSFASALGPVGIAAGVAGVALIGLGAASTKAAMAWEDMKTSIGRTTGLEGDNLEDLMSQLQDLRQEMGITAEAASSMVEQAGSIGVGQSKLNAGDVVGYKQEILDFAKATAILQGAWGMSAEATSSGIGKMGSVTLNAWNVQRKARGEEEMSWADYAYKVGGQTDALANAMGSSEEEIVTAMRNASGAVAKFAPSEETYGKWQAMASFLIDTGSSAGEAGTQIERVAQKMDQNAVDVAAVMGIDQATLSTNLKTDFMGTIQQLGESIAAMPESARPDTAKMFGLEGKVLIDKVVADIEAGTGKLQNAYDLALNPSNVAEGYEDVANNASKAFDRIGQAFQVSLEKIGGQLLPIVTDVANGIADAWIAANEAGTEIFGAAKQVADNGLEMAINGEEYVLDWSGLHKRTAEEIAEATSEGSTSGLAAGAENAKGAITESTKSAVEDAYEEVAKASKEFSAKYGSQYAAGMTQIDGTWVSNQERESFYKDKSLQSGEYSTFANGEVAWNLLKESASGKSGTLKAVISVDGTEYTREFSTMEDTAESATKKIKAEFRDVALDISKYIKSAGRNVSDSLTDMLSDGVVSFTEKNELGEYIRSLDELNAEFPLEFKAANLDEVKRDVQATLDGVDIKINLDAESFAISAAEYIDEHFDLYSKMYGKGYVAQKPDEEAYFKLMEGYKERGDDEVVSQLQDIDTLIETGDRDQAEVLNSKLEYVVKAHPELVDQTAFLSRVALADETMLSDTMVQNGHLSFIQSSSETTSTNTKDTVVAINNLANIIGSGGFGTTVVNAYAEGTTASQNLKVSQMAAAKSTGTPLKFSTVSLSSAKALANEFGIPGFETGAVKVQPPGGLAFIGEGSETEYVFTESQIKGLYPDFAKAAKGSMKWLTGEKYFDDYPGARISSPTSYRWSSYPDAPQVQQLNTENMQTAWLSEGQTTGLDMISSEIRDLQLASIGKSQVQPWFAKGEIKQPDWWVEAATALSPQYKENWAASKGGTVPPIVENVGTKSAAKLSNSSAWSSIYDNSGTCIAFVEPDPSLKFTPGKTKNSALDKTAWNAIYDNSGTCIAFVEPDPSLKFTPAAGSISSGDAIDVLDSIDANTRNTKIALDNTIDVLKMGIFATSGMQEVKGTFATTGKDDLVTGLSKEGYVVSYDPRTDTCEGMAFNAPDPSLKTTDKFYLGLTKNSPYRSEDKASGYGWENVAQTDDQALQQLMKIDEESQKTSESSEQTAENTNDVYRTLGQQYALQQKALALGGATLDATGALVSLVGGGSSGGTGLYGSTAGSFWGGLSVGGGGGSIGTGASMSGWGAQASNSISGNTGTVNIGQGAMYYAEGGITDHPVFGVFGEAGREAFVPISDKAAGRRILPQVMRELGVRAFATGGIVGSGGLSALTESIGPTSIVYSPTINADGLSKSQALSLVSRSQDKFLEKVAKKIKLSGRRRG